MVYVKQNIAFEDLSTFGERLRYERERQNLSRPALAELTEGALSARAISHLENGSTEATIQRSEILAEALNADCQWLGYGDRSNLQGPNDNTGQYDDTRDSDFDEPADEPVDPDNMPGHAQNTGEYRANRSETPATTGVTGDTGDTGADQNEPVESDPARMYIDEMLNLLLQVDVLRVDGLEHHPRKMPKLLEQAKAVGECLEIADLQELAFERDIDPSDIEAENVSEEEMDEFVLRLIDTAVLGIDLRTLDRDTLDAFVKKYEIDQPIVGRRKRRRLVIDVRELYWRKAMEGKLRLTTSLRDTG